MKRLPTLVEGLDDILNGGLFEGGVYIFEGPPGVGKTTLANQIAYTLARREIRTLYVTMLAESHARMLQHMEQQIFFDQQEVSATVFYVSGYRELEQGGLKAVVGLLRGELIRHRASLLVLDGLVVDSLSTTTNDAVRQFVHELQSLVSAMSCTCLILTSGNSNSLSAEQTMVDGIFAFEDHGFHWRAERRMQVRKFRGSMVLRGQHTFCLSSKGVQFFPRLESLPLVDASARMGPDIVPTGWRVLDAALRGGGFLSGSASLVVGDSGTGKTTLALAFAAASGADGTALVLSCTELASDLRRLSTELGLGVEAALFRGELMIRNLGQEDESMDEMGHQLLRLVDEFKIRRLVVDGVAGLADTLAFKDRGYRFLGRLLVELRRRGVTCLFTMDPEALAVAAGAPLADGLVGWFDNLFVFDATPASDRLVNQRILRVAKIRGGAALKSSVDIAVSLPQGA
ncbi:RAD55 family ATPase [Comamonas endophytica]|uniref:NACHT domain-containing protein n=1 Tax=Comamonas endophytica TaxID=2949090 RepID=A0ABY6G8W2_9BURK|nr:MULTISPECIES: ATPase domain-containing protein [unclassified Acidovorax]MCD2511746.1 NACHT domain-containing protein [Acidovorax sp. D4N7]UYG51470.1 NACHT domain-containing protein [Acidovorax sp. 5MLIR]